MEREIFDFLGDGEQVGIGLGTGLELIIGRQNRMVRVALSPPQALKISIELLVRCRDDAIAEARRELLDRKQAHQEEVTPCH